MFADLLCIITGIETVTDLRIELLASETFSKWRRLSLTETVGQDSIHLFCWQSSDFGKKKYD